jgi:hypothetical protein
VFWKDRIKILAQGLIKLIEKCYDFLWFLWENIFIATEVGRDDVSPCTLYFVSNPNFDLV